MLKRQTVVDWHIESDELLTKREVLNILKIGKSTLGRWQSDRNFPRPIVLGGNTVRWSKNAVNGWVMRQLSPATDAVQI